MNNAEFREVRRTLGLSVNQLAEILNTNSVTIRRWEMDGGKNTARDPNPIACQVLQWLRDGRLKL